jgi:sulfide:quinone oxidoreductase
MKLMRVNESLSVSGQINEQDLEALAAEGVQLVVCNRPDGESAEQPEFSALQASSGEARAGNHRYTFQEW